MNDSVAIRYWWIAFGITAASALVSLAFSITALVTEGSPLSFYAASRSLALAVASIALVRWRSTDGLVVVALLMAAVQAMDAVIGAVAGDPAKTLGPAFLAAASVVAVGLLLRARR